MSYKRTDRCREYALAYYYRRRAVILPRQAVYRACHREQLRLRALEWVRQKREKDPTWRVKNSLQCHWKRRLRLVGVYDAEPFLTLLGCKWVEFARQLEESFRFDWDWSNYGTKWNVQHVHLLCAFNLHIREERMMCSHHSNLTAMDALENATLAGRFDPEEVEAYKRKWREQFGS